MIALDPRLVKANPVLGLAPAREALANLSARELEAVSAVLLAIQADARQLAEKSWKTHKGPMAAYWKAVGVYCGHIARAARRIGGEVPEPDPLGDAGAALHSAIYLCGDQLGSGDPLFSRLCDAADTADEAARRIHR